MTVVLAALSAWILGRRRLRSPSNGWRRLYCIRLRTQPRVLAGWQDGVLYNGSRDATLQTGLYVKALDRDDLTPRSWAAVCSAIHLRGRR
jgi:hypothetical protein